MTTQKLSPAADRLLEADRCATFVTVNADGSPHVSLMWISRDGDDLVFGVEQHRVKVRNLRRDPRITVLVEDDRDAEHGLRQHLIVRGTVTFEGPGIPERFAAFMDRQAQRYLGTDYPFANRESTTALIGRIRVEHVSGVGPWAH
ncbi:TIGR03618 family F420-dependent PPOX class oxidoreductase [Nonomuraea deserti]|uniref:TIGR03618 family F420-dependent PPOX class oxidoreductase n=1 Tax=Nonomuraea deserti TaxID=1848322 RepID=A0A4R4W368_9ACTN|nr:TIGR03618 family F420-dependent PPOX class oxidoreductase [Nonomuraea deserti]TDD12321.1 TIGR03618 family F420-dependent PPOX class oxidoreductase [Nonomuraea deserti]